MDMRGDVVPIEWFGANFVTPFLWNQIIFSVYVEGKRRQVRPVWVLSSYDLLEFKV